MVEVPPPRGFKAASMGTNFKPVTIEDVNNEIESELYHLFPGTNTTVCCLVLKNGFTITGSNACTDAAKFDPSLGRKFAKEKALDGVWQVLGFRLQDQIADSQK